MEYHGPLNWPVQFERSKDQKSGKFGKKDNLGWGIKKLTLHQSIKRLEETIRAFTRNGKDWVIDPDNVIISSNLDLKVNGEPRVQRDPDDNGVCVNLTMDGEPYVFPCDTYDRLPDNIIAVSEHLETLRTQQRHGVGTRKQAFTGYKRLESMKLDWEAVLGVSKDADWLDVVKASRALRKEHHSDTGDGDTVKFQAAIDAFNAAKKHFGI